eukprot:gene1648-1016_t
MRLNGNSTSVAPLSSKSEGADSPKRKRKQAQQKIRAEKPTKQNKTHQQTATTIIMPPHQKNRSYIQGARQTGCKAIQKVVESLPAVQTRFLQTCVEGL